MLVSPDGHTRNLFAEVFGGVGIQVQQFGDELKAGRKFDRSRFAAIVPDFYSMERLDFVIQCPHESQRLAECMDAHFVESTCASSGNEPISNPGER